MTSWKALEWKTDLDGGTGVRIHHLTGVLTDSEGSYKFLSRALEESKQDPRPMLLDMAGVEHLTSAGVGVLAALYTSAQNAKTPIALAALTRRGQLILHVVHLESLVAIYDSVEGALAARTAGGWKPTG